MTSIVPELDDIDFDRLVEDGRGLIPRYAEDWTDHNLHDPGITLIDLIAWLADIHVYRIGFVGDSLKAAFTRLMGIAPSGPEPAEMLIWPTDPVPILGLAKGAEISSPDAIEARFTLTHDLRTVAPGIDGVFIWSHGVRKPLGKGLSEGRDPLDLLPPRGGGPEMLEIELEAPIDPLDGTRPVSLGLELVNETSGSDAVRRDPLTIEQWDRKGYWRPLSSEDGTDGLRKSGVILFRPSDASAAERFRLRLDQGFRLGQATLTRLAFNVLPAREGWDDPAAVIGEGTGLPDQRIEFETEDIVDRESALVIETNVGGIEQQWERRDNFDESGPADAHYRLGEDGLVFGNGLNGMPPPPGAQIRRGKLRRTCGTLGAVTADLTWTIAGQTIGVNRAPSTPGRDRDGLQQLTSRARAVSRARDSALRSDRIRDALIEAGLGLADVQVRAQRRPAFDGKDAPGSRTALVLPVRDPETPPGPPHARLRDEVQAILAPLRLLGERLYVSEPVYAPIDIVLTLIVEADTDLAALEAEAEAILRARLWDLRRREDVDPWPAGRDVTIGEIEGLMARLPDVVRIGDCRLAKAGGPLERETIKLLDREIALAQRIDVRARREGEGDP